MTPPATVRPGSAALRDLRVRVGPAVWTYLTMAAACLGITNLVQTGPWLRPVLAIMLGITVAVWLAWWAMRDRHWFWQFLVAGLAGEAVLTCSLVHWLARSEAPLGFVPRWHALVVADQHLSVARASLGPAVPPTSQTALFAPLVAFAMGHLVVLAAMAGIVGRWPVLVGLAATAPWVACVALRPASTWGWALVTGACFLGLLAWSRPPPGRVFRTSDSPDPARWLDRPTRGSRVPVASAVALACAVGFVVTAFVPVLPGWGAGTRWVQGIDWGGAALNTGPGINVDGVFDVNGQLTTPNSAVLLRMKGSYTGALKLYSLEDFDGGRWTRPDGSTTLPAEAGNTLWPSPDGLTGFQGSADLTLDLSAWTYDYLPLAVGPRVVTSPIFADYDPFVDSVTHIVARDDPVTQRVPLFDPAQTAEAGISTDGLALRTYAPVDLPHAAQIQALASQIVSQAGATTPDAALRAIIAYLNTSHFHYTLKPDIDPNSADPVWDFLQRGTGYCVHYATALVVLGRSLGIPMRVAVGLAGPSAGANGWRVFTAAQSHMWAEAHLTGAGWVPYEATPAIAGVIAPTPSATPSVQSQSPEPMLTPSRPPPTGPTGAPSSTAPVGPGGAGGFAVPWPWVGGAGGVVVAGMLAWAVAAWRRRRAGRLETAWDDVLARAKKASLVRDTMTPRQARDAVRADLDDDAARQGVDALAGAVEATRYGPPDAVVPPSADQVRTWRAAVLARLKPSRHEA